MSGGPEPKSPSRPQPLAWPKEGAALRRVMIFGVLQLAGLVAGLAALVYYSSASAGSFNLGQVLNSSSLVDEYATSLQVNALLTAIDDFSLILVAGVAVEFASLAVLFLSFHEMRKVDRAGFSVPWVLVFVYLTGLVVVAAGILTYFDSLSNLITAVTEAQGGAMALFSTVGGLATAVGLLGLGGVMSLAGLIGQTLGIWRLGTRYMERNLKLGAVFSLIPGLNFAAPFLLFFGANSARNRRAPPV